MKRMKVIYEPKGAALEYAPLAVNLYVGCQHGCTYCYVPGCLRKTREAFHTSALPRRDIMMRLAKDCISMQKEKDEREVLLCFACDPYPMEFDRGTTRYAMNMLGTCGLNASILTKNGAGAERDFDIMKKFGFRFGVTLGFMDQDMAKQYEPNAGHILYRAQALAKAHEMGIRTWVSVEPVIDPAEALAVMGWLKDVVDEWKVGKWNHSAEAKQIDWKQFLADARGILDGKNVTYKHALLKAAGEVE